MSAVEGSAWSIINKSVIFDVTSSANAHEDRFAAREKESTRQSYVQKLLPVLFSPFSVTNWSEYGGLWKGNITVNNDPEIHTKVNQK